MTKEGYQPIKTEKTTKIVPPNTGSNVQMKKDGYTWEDLDKAWWEGFNNAKSKMEKHIAELKKQLDLKEKALSKAKKETKRIADRVNKDKRRLIRRKAELEQQIEEMKCCFNCKHSRTEYEHCKTDKHEKWEIKEK